MKELTIHHIPAKDGAPARVRVSYRPQEGAQAQERETGFNFAVTNEQHRDIQWYLEEYLLFPWGEFRNRARQSEELMERLGAELFDAVFNNRAATVTERTYPLYAHVADDLANTRIVVHATEPEGIAIPWELMRDPTRGEYGDLARLAYAFVRSQPNLIFQPPPEPTSEPTLNVLMVICRPGGEEDVPFQSVARPLLELFRPHRDHVRLEVLRPPTFEQLAGQLSKKPNFYHALHFDGHGVFPQGAGGQGLLLFEGEDGKPRRVTGEELGRLLAGKGVPVVLLNACQSGMTHPESLYPSVGNQLLKAGVRGVVAMTYSVYVQTAVRFMARLYESLMNGLELSRAVALAREDLWTHPQRFSPIGEVPLRDWIVPVLFESAPTRLTEQSLRALRLDVSLLQDQQAAAGQEIDCPERPAFGFIGRDDVTQKLERAFREETIVLLEGMAGVGKTETAVGFARWWVETGALDGPIFFFRFEHYLPLSRVCNAVGQQFNHIVRRDLGQDWHTIQDEGNRRRIALDLLKRARCLLIWDNFEPVHGFPTGTESAWKPEEQEELRQFLSDLRDGRTKVLITSRRDEQWLGNIYRRVELGGLKPVEAQELAVKVLNRALTPQEIRALPPYDKLLDYLRGNPLAIQVILPELKRTTPDALLAALQSGEAKLSADDPTQRRERSLYAALNYRLDALDSTLRQRLGMLGMFQGFVNAEVLEAICQQVEGAPDLIRGLGRDDWIRMLDTAAEMGLLRALGEGDYTIHPALPWFFHDLLHEAFPDHQDWLERAFSTVYGAVGGELFELFQTNTQFAMSLLRAEENNLTYALHLARQHERWGDVTGILYGLQKSLVTQGRWVEWERLIISIEAEVTDADGEPLTGREDLWRALAGHRSEIAHYRRDFDSEQIINLRLKEHFERRGDDLNHAVALHKLGMIAQEQHLSAEAEQWYQQSLDISKRIGDEHGQARTLHQLGMVAEERRQFAEAEQWYQQSLAIKERIGDEQGQANTLAQLGNLAQRQGQFEEAERWYRQALPIFERIGDKYGQAQTLHNLGTVAEEQGQFEEAERWCRQSLQVKERIGDEQGQAQTLHQLGIIAEDRQQFEEAKQWYRQSLAIAEHIGDEQGQAQTLGQLGNLAQIRQQFEEAERWYRQALPIFERIGDEHGQASTLHNLGRLAEQRGNVAEAARFYTQAEALFVRLNDQRNLEIVRRSLQRVQRQAPQLSEFVARAWELSEAGKWQEAERVLNEGIQWCKEHSDLTNAVTLFRERARVRVKMRAYDQARWDYKKAVSLCEELNDVTMLAEVEVELAELEYRTGLFKDAVYHLDRAAEHLQAAGENGERIDLIHRLLEDVRTHAVPRSGGVST